MRTRWNVPLLAAFILFAEGFGFPLVKIGLGYIDALPLLLVRFSTGALAVFLVLWLRERGRFGMLVLCPAAVGGGLICGFICGIGMVVQTVGLHYTTAAKGAFISSTVGILIPLVGLFFRRRPPLSACVGLAGATVGLAIFNGVLRFDGGLSLAPLGALNIGDGLMLLSAICFAVQLNALNSFEGRCDPVAFSGWQAVAIATLAGVLWPLLEPAAKVELWEPAALAILLFLGPLGSGLIFVAQILIQKKIAPARAALIYASTPIPAALFAAVIPDRTGMVEQITPPMVVGGLIVILSVAATQIIQARRAERRGEGDV